LETKGSRTTRYFKTTHFSCVVSSLLGKTLRFICCCGSRTVLGVLTQEHRGQRQPVIFISKLLNLVSQGWPECIQSVTATATLVEESRKLTFLGALIVRTPHQVGNIVN
jgi:hypothetical protein